MLADVIRKDLSIVFCGLNPGNQAAASGYHFVGGSNRFWRVVHLAGFTPQQIRAQDGHSLLGYGCGLTTVVERATAGADELARHEFVAARAAFERKIARYRPRCVAFLGKPRTRRCSRNARSPGAGSHRNLPVRSPGSSRTRAEGIAHSAWKPW